jgi:shikimate kinase
MAEPLDTSRLPTRTIVLIGLMGAGKTTVGRRLAARIERSFVDADSEIERAAGMTVPEIFAQHGESAFRDGERRVIARLLTEPPHVLATGGGAYMDARTRDAIRHAGVSVWLKADLDELHQRVQRRSNRPLLAGGDPRAVLERLMAERYPIYAEADLTVECNEGPPEAMVERVVAALVRFQAGGDKSA